MSYSRRAPYDLIVVGGGFYGLRIALHARESLGFGRIAVLESEPQLMTRASFVNQARVHNGYHYPRSMLTAYRSRINFPSFVDEYRAAIVSNFDHYYAVARRLSMTNARQFETFCTRVGVSWEQASPKAASYFDSSFVDSVYKVEEPAFNSRILRKLLLSRIQQAGGIEVLTGTEVVSLHSQPDDRVLARTVRGDLLAERVISAVYSGINVLHRASGIPTLRLQHEVTQMALVRLPESLRRVALTVVDGPFFSLMPFPPRGLHTLSHVRFTPVLRWHDEDGDLANPRLVLAANNSGSKFPQMYADVVRYVPSMSGMVHVDTISETKTVLSRSAGDDSRPIFFGADHGIRNYTCVIGGKLDNVYDVLEELTALYGR